MIKKENLQLSRFLFVMCCLIVAIHCQIVYMVNIQSYKWCDQVFTHRYGSIRFLYCIWIFAISEI